MEAVHIPAAYLRPMTPLPHLMMDREYHEPKQAIDLEQAEWFLLILPIIRLSG